MDEAGEIQFVFEPQEEGGYRVCGAWDGASYAEHRVSQGAGARMSKRLATLALVAVSLLLGACGGKGEKTETVIITQTTPTTETQPPTTETTETSAYQDEVARVDSDLGELSDDVPSAQGFGSASFTRRAFALGDRVDEVVDRLESLDPPAQVAREHEDLVVDVEEVKDLFDHLAAASESDESEEAVAVLDRISGALSRTRETIGDILEELNR